MGGCSCACELSSQARSRRVHHRIHHLGGKAEYGLDPKSIGTSPRRISFSTHCTPPSPKLVLCCTLLVSSSGIIYAYSYMWYIFSLLRNAKKRQLRANSLGRCWKTGVPTMADPPLCSHHCGRGVHPRLPASMRSLDYFAARTRRLMLVRKALSPI
jgi:hypothetical protein